MFKIHQIKMLEKKESIEKLVPKLVSTLEILSIDTEPDSMTYRDALMQHVAPFIKNEEKEEDIYTLKLAIAESEGQTLLILAKKLKSINADILDLQPKSLQIEKELDTLHGRFHKEFEEIDNVISIKKNDLKNAGDDFSKLKDDIVKKDKDRIKIFEEKYKDVESKIWESWEQERNQIVQKHEKQKQQFSSLISSQEKTNEELERSSKKVLEYFNITDQVFESGGFLLAANNEAEQANKLRWIAIGLMTVVAIAVLITAYLLKDPSLTDFVSRFIMIFTLMIPAGYAAREASRHRTNSEMYRVAGTEMTSLKTFLDGLNDDQIAAIKETLVGKYFGNFRFVGEKGSSAGVDDLLNLFEKILKRKKKNSKDNQDSKEDSK